MTECGADADRFPTPTIKGEYQHSLCPDIVSKDASGMLGRR